MASRGRRWTRDRRHHQEDGGEAWLVSYADMMTLLFGFFVIMYSLSAVDEKKLSDVGKEIAEALGHQKIEIQDNNTVGGMNDARRIRALELLVAVMNVGDSTDQVVEKIERATIDKDLRQSMQAMLKEQLPQTSSATLAGRMVVEGSEGDQDQAVRIGLSDRILFAPGTNQLTPSARSELRQLAKVILATPGLSGIEVLGHTDATPGDPRLGGNLGLSAARAVAVAHELVQAGVREGMVQAIGMGASKPLFPEVGVESAVLRDHRLKNRRVELVLRRSGLP